jgi:multiple antibiotic resistance protein
MVVWLSTPNNQKGAGMWSDYANLASFALVTLFSIIDPMGNVPLFLAITQQNTLDERKAIIRKATFTCSFILMFFLITGNFILEIFHITIGAFKIAGGVLIFIISIQMLFVFKPGQKTSPKEEQEALAKEDVSFFPLAIPLLCGPGAITTVILLRSNCHTFMHYTLILVVIVAVSFLTYGILRESQHLMKILGQTGINILTRLMGLVLSVVAVQFVLDGIKSALPDLVKQIPS